jgi:predicted molibdopterin-dependent oxidoreductase YjgC
MDGDAAATSAADGELVLYTGRMIYDDGAMAGRSAALRNLAKRPFVELNDVDAKNFEIADGDDVVIATNGTEVTLRAIITDISRGTAFVPYDQPGLRANRLMSGMNPAVKVRRA